MPERTYIMGFERILFLPVIVNVFIIGVINIKVFSPAPPERTYIMGFERNLFLPVIVNVFVISIINVLIRVLTVLTGISSVWLTLRALL